MLVTEAHEASTGWDDHRGAVLDVKRHRQPVPRPRPRGVHRGVTGRLVVVGGVDSRLGHRMDGHKSASFVAAFRMAHQP